MVWLEQLAGITQLVQLQSLQLICGISELQLLQKFLQRLLLQKNYLLIIATAHNSTNSIQCCIIVKETVDVGNGC